MIEDIWRPLAVSPSRIHSKGNDDAIPRAMAVSLGEMDAPNLHLKRRPERWRILVGTIFAVDCRSAAQGLKQKRTRQPDRRAWSKSAL
jgi:hypothetical protein